MDQAPPPPLPQLQQVPDALVAKWDALPPNTPVQLTRTDITNLFFAIDGAFHAQASTLESLVSYSNGDLDSASRQKWEASRQIIEAGNRLRNLIINVMVSAT